MTDVPARRLLFVHAHPDDESINNGATMARYAAEGAAVTLVTCTLGEEGEVIPPSLAHLASHSDDTLGEYRAGELAAAMRELGVTDHRFLGGAGRYRDSGMWGSERNTRPECFWQASRDTVADDLVRIIREVRPQVLVTYDPRGGYGHPDHIRAHRVATRAAELAAREDYRPDTGSPHRIARLYWNCVARSQVDAGFARLRELGPDAPFDLIAGLDEVPGVVADTEVAVSIAGGERYAAAKSAAMRAHATQIAVEEPFFALSNARGQPLLTTEHYRIANEPAPRDAPADDLFSGVAL